MQNECKNCGNMFTGKYCNNCGQKFDVPAFTFKHIFKEAFHGFTHADKSFILFLKELVINPGKLAYEYIIERKRKKYFNPFTFFVLITTINALIESMNINLRQKLFNFNDTYGHTFNIYSKILSLVIIPVVAFAIWLIHIRKPRVRYSEYTVFAMILLSLFSVIGIFVQAMNYSITAITHHIIFIENNLWFLGLMILYISYACFNFHIKLNNSTIINSLTSGLFFFVAIFAVQLFIVFAIINHFEGIGNFYLYGIKISQPQ